MDEKDFASADVMVLGVLAASTGTQSETVGYTMASIEKFGVKGEWFRDLRHRQFFEAAVAAWREHRTLDVFHVKQKYEAGDGVGFAVMNRMLKSAGYNIVKV